MSRIVSCRMTSWHSRSPRTYMGQSRATVASQRSGHAVDHFSAPWINDKYTEQDYPRAPPAPHRHTQRCCVGSPALDLVDQAITIPSQCRLPAAMLLSPVGSPLHIRNWSFEEIQPSSSKKKYASRISCCDLPLLSLARCGPTPCLSRSFLYRVEHTRQRHSGQNKARVRENIFFDKVKMRPVDLRLEADITKKQRARSKKKRCSLPLQQ